MTNETRGDRDIAWIESNLKIEGSNVALLDFQKEFIRKIYDEASGNGTAVLSVARKNGKTTLLVMLALLHLVGLEAEAQSTINVATCSPTIAKHIYKLARIMVTESPAIRPFVKFNAANNALTVEEPGTTLNVIPYTKLVDNPCDILLVEEGGMINVDTLPANDAKLTIHTSTAGMKHPNVLNAAIVQANVFEHFICPNDVDWKSEEAIKLANPSLGKIASHSRINEDQTSAAKKPDHEIKFRHLMLNQPKEASNARLLGDQPTFSINQVRALLGLNPIV